LTVTVGTQILFLVNSSSRDTFCYYSTVPLVTDPVTS
jgi:hypothetical protein